jgi:membrane-associated phospholipid phosphatase
MREWPIGVASWLLVLAGAELAALLMVWRFFVRSEHGQLLDTVALAGNSIGQARVEQLVLTILNAMSVASLTVATAVVGFIALIRRRIAVAFGAILLIAGANATTQVLKHLIYRPQFGVDLQRDAAGNSLPSGHTTIAASVVVALVLVLPARARGIAGAIGTLFAALAGVATLSAGWHRPSDAVAALLVVGVWGCVAGLFIVAVQRGHGAGGRGGGHRTVALVLAVAGLVLLAGAAIALRLTDQVLAVPVGALSRRRLLVAYVGGAMGIAGTAGVVLAAVLATVHRVVPATVQPGPDPAPAHPRAAG